MPKAEQEFSFKYLFVPLTTLKAIHFFVIIGFLVFGNALFNKFVLDDVPVIITNTNVHTLSRTLDIFLNPNNAKEVISYYRPVLFTIYAIIYSLVQEKTFLYHFIQLLFYIGNSVLLFLIFKKYLKKGIAFFLSLLLLVHPINQETAAYISNLQDVLFVFWGLIAIYILQKNSDKLQSIIFANIFILLSLFSKESGILFILVTLIYVYLFNKRKFFYHLLFSSLTSTVYLLLRIISQVPFQKEAGIPIMEMSLWERIGHIPIIIFTYLKTFIYPKDLIVLQSWVITDINLQTFYLPLLYDVIFFAVLLSFCVVIYKRSKEIKLIILFLSWFVMGLILHLQIIPLDATIGNRYFYFPFIGLLGLLGLFLQSIKLNKRYSTSVIVLGIILLTVLSVRTMIRNNDWREQRTLISHDISLTRDDYIMEYLYGIELIKDNQDDKALLHTKKAIELYPRSWNAWNNLGIIYSKKGDINRAKDAYLHSMAIKRNLGAYENLALLFLQNERFEEADKFIDESLKLYPNSEKLWYYRILVGYKNKNYDEALIAAKRYYTLRRDKKSYDIYQQLLQKQNTNVPPNY